MDATRYAVAIGASTGGVDALLQIAAGLPPRFPAPIFITQHIGSNTSVLPELIRRRGPNHAMQPLDGDTPVPGTIYVAPPDLHLLLERGRIRLSRGPKENHCRPAIDPMFRSIAMEFRQRAIGVILSGFLDDGAAGLATIKSCGGAAIVQDPASAFEPSMPRAALAATQVDWMLPVEEIPAMLARLVDARPARTDPGVADALRREQELVHEDNIMENLSAIATPSTFTCPDCGGAMWELKEGQPLRYRCHVGHAFSVGSLEHSQQVTAEKALWSGVRALRERAMLLRRLAHAARGNAQNAEAQAGEAQAMQLESQADTLVRLIEGHNGGA